MLSYEETLNTLEEMRSRFDSGFSSSDKAKIEELYFLVCGKRVRNTGCRDCYRDAYIETRTTLKRLGKMPKKPNYSLKAGAIVHPQGTSKFYSLNNIPDDVAEKWLGQYPNEITKFETFPTDWESRVKARQEGTVHEPTYDELKAEIERLSGVVDAKDAEIEKQKAEIEQLKAEVDNSAAEMEIETLKADLATANETIEKGKQEAQEEVVNLNKSNAELKVKLADATDLCNKQKAEIEQLKVDLEAAKKSAKEAPKAEEKK